ncbi:hypothetical protein BDZ97DRAFT_1873585, partial [Flammula alnicola]
GGGGISPPRIAAPRIRIRIRTCLLHTNNNTHLPLFHLTQHHSSSSSSSSNQHTRSTPPQRRSTRKATCRASNMGTGRCRIHLHLLFNLHYLPRQPLRLPPMHHLRPTHRTPLHPHHRLRTNFIPVLLGTHPTNTRSNTSTNTRCTDTSTPRTPTPRSRTPPRLGWV